MINIEKHISVPHRTYVAVIILLKGLNFGTSELGKSSNLNKNLLEHAFLKVPKFPVSHLKKKNFNSIYQQI